MRTYFIIGLIWIAVSGQAADSGSVNYNGVVSNVGCMAAANDQGPYCYFTVSSSLGCFGDVISFSANS
ncbi:hypothetical protein EBT16_10245, partial [bacterium]|nr:hypothetical protein [bacterium]